MTKRLLLTLALICAALLAPAAAHAKPKIAFSDNQVRTLTDKRFKATGIKQVRKLVPYDAIARGGGQLREMDTWFATAKSLGIEPLVSFYRSSRGKRRIPTVSGYRKYFRQFRQRYPEVKLFSTWNEANFPDAQPTGRFPKRTAQFYKVARSECRGGKCKVLTMDFRADGSNFSLKWLKTFKRHMGRGPHTWGLVSHPDVTRFSTKRTRQFLKNTRGDVWAVEIGAVNFFGRGIKPSIRRQTKSMRYLMRTYPKVSRRLKRMYVYNWRAGRYLWDSGLIGLSGKPRPAYFVFFKALGKKAPR